MHRDPKSNWLLIKESYFWFDIDEKIYNSVKYGVVIKKLIFIYLIYSMLLSGRIYHSNGAPINLWSYHN